MTKKLLNFFISTSALVLLAGCAHNRETPTDFERVSATSVPTKHLPAFIDCVSDKFRDQVAGIGVSWTNRQQRRSNMYRVELFSDDLGPLLSADIYDDGRVELFETTYPVRTRLGDERAGFAACMEKYK
jgi:hypothetical protein